MHYGYRGLKIFTSLPLRFQDFQRSHPEQSSRAIAECFAEEQPLLMPVTASFDAYVEAIKRVSQLCLIRIDRNRYSVPAQ